MLEYDINELLNQAGIGLWNAKFLLVWLYCFFITFETNSFTYLHYKKNHGLHCNDDTFDAISNETVNDGTTLEDICNQENLSWILPSVFVTFALIFSIIVDRFGRKQTLMIVTIAQVALILSSLQTFSSNSFLSYLVHCIGLVLKELQFYGILILLCECSTKSNRAIFLYVSYFLYTVINTHLESYADLSIIKNDKTLAICVALTLTVELYLLWKVIDESPRWLLQKQRFKETANLIEKIFKENKSQLQTAVNEVINEMATLKFDDKNRNSIFCCDWNLCALLTTKNAILQMITLAVNWYAIQMLFLVFSEDVETEQAVIFKIINFSFVVIVFVLQYFIANKFGRKLAFQTSIISTISLCVFLKFLNSLIDTSNFLTKIGMPLFYYLRSAAEGSLFILSTECLPTIVRASGMAFAYACVFPVSMLNHLLLHSLNDLWFYTIIVPSLIVVLMASMLLPETLNNEIPDDIEEYHLQTSNVSKPQNVRQKPESELIASFI